MAKIETLRWRIVTVLLFAALLPLALTGFGSWIIFGRLLERKSVESMENTVLNHAHAIEAYLDESVHLLQLLVETNSIEELSTAGRLQELSVFLNRTTGGRFVDLGVIDADGRHLAYAGPYDLQDRNYREADWFEEVMIRGVFVSDVFLGFRQFPHCIIAVKASQGLRPWILRATINSERFEVFVRTGDLGEGSDAFIVNSEGLYQTPPKGGARMDRYPGLGEVHRGVRDDRTTIDGVTKLKVTTWINDSRWALVVEQNLDTIRAPVNQAILQGAWVVLVAIGLLVLTTFLATRHLSRRIDQANAQREEMGHAFLRSAKLASIGELSTGLAHEINNPLAIISAEQTNISDLLKEMAGPSETRELALASAERCKLQVQRCANITRKMLIKEIVNLLQRQARLRNVAIITDIENDLPRIYVDPVEFEQVLVNLINNAMDAIPDGGEIRIRARQDEDQVHLEVRDNGTGIAADDLARIFEPFFTTKPVGKGTGLGLAVCYGVIHSWGGRIRAESELGKGTTMHIHVPVQRQSAADGHRAGETDRAPRA
ncbi:MAG: hypothetical protein FJW35_14545 [Acidobacteria bacterium]|nr:hypothetical protein [Acidobacteriota bacterium]